MICFSLKIHPFVNTKHGLLFQWQNILTLEVAIHGNCKIPFSIICVNQVSNTKRNVTQWFGSTIGRNVCHYHMNDGQWVEEISLHYCLSLPAFQCTSDISSKWYHIFTYHCFLIPQNTNCEQGVKAKKWHLLRWGLRGLVDLSQLRFYMGFLHPLTNLLRLKSLFEQISKA